MTVTDTAAAPRINVELALRVLAHIDAHPELHMQGEWIAANDCGTAACFAGWACLLAGATPAWIGGADTTARVIAPDGQSELVADHARRLLNLDWRDADWLFAPGNSRKQLRAIVDLLAGGRGLCHCAKREQPGECGCPWWGPVQRHSRLCPARRPS